MTTPRDKGASLSIAVLCTNDFHPIIPHLEHWVEHQRQAGHSASLYHDKGDLVSGDVLFLVSCSQLISARIRQRFKSTIVLHASNLPNGRGWSPHVWAVLAGESHIHVCALEAADPVDTGNVLLRTSFVLEGHELLPEINNLLFAAELDLMSRVVEVGGELRGTVQGDAAGMTLRRRTPEDSRLDPTKSIEAQFELLRIVDNERYPAFFEYRGYRYILRIEKAAGQ